jgi:hypothetical protein
MRTPPIPACHWQLGSRRTRPGRVGTRGGWLSLNEGMDGHANLHANACSEEGMPCQGREGRPSRMVASVTTSAVKPPDLARRRTYGITSLCGLFA